MKIYKRMFEMPNAPNPGKSSAYKYIFLIPNALNPVMSSAYKYIDIYLSLNLHE